LRRSAAKAILCHLPGQGRFQRRGFSPTALGAMSQSTAPLSHVGDALPLTIDDIRAAADRIRGAVVRTPTLRSRTLSQITGAEIWLKFENLQFTAAYKERGALNALLMMDGGTLARGVIAASAGNHSQGLSHHGTRLGVPVTIVMPRTTPAVKIMQTESVGGNVVLEGETFDEAYAHARKLEQELGLTFVHPFDDPRVAAGAGTVALEMLEDAPEIDCMVVPIGGGGLMSGMATVARALKPEMDVVGVQAALFPSMYAKVNGRDMACGGDTLAEGIAVKAPGEFTSQVIAERVDEILLVGEDKLEKAVSLLLQIEKTVVEGAPGTLRRAQDRAGAVRRQYRHAPARQCAAARPRALGPPRAAADHLAGSPWRAVQGDARVQRASGQHHRDLPPAHLHDPARQGPDHRHRVRGARRRAARRAGRGAAARGLCRQPGRTGLISRVNGCSRHCPTCAK
jgi:threonine dehydratase